MAGRIGTDGEVNEAPWQQSIVRLALTLGWEVYHTHDSRRTTSDGFPDLILARDGEVVAAEIKRWDGDVKPRQRIWLNLLARAGIPCYVWRADKSGTGNVHWQEISDILARGPGQIGRAERQRWVADQGIPRSPRRPTRRITSA